MMNVVKKRSCLKRSMKKRTKKKTQNNISATTVFNFPVKRLRMIRRRLVNLMEDRRSWDAKNKQLSEKLTEVVLANESLREEIVECRQLYHETLTSLKSFKIMDHIIRSTIASFQFQDNPHAQLAALEREVTKSEHNIGILHTFLPSSDENNALPRQMFESSVNYKENNMLTERVGPRVKGLGISKPQIMLEQVMLPSADYRDPDSQETSERTSTQKHGNSLQSIHEDQPEYEIPLGTISLRKKSRLGNVQKTQKDKSTENSHDSQVPIDASNTTVIKSPIACVEPVVRLSDVSRLLRNSSLMQVGSCQLENTENSSKNRETVGSHFCNSHGQKYSEDTIGLEGCSWMTDEQNYQSSIRKSRYTYVIRPSDLLDDDSDCTPTNRHTYTTPYSTSPLANTLLNSTANSMCDSNFVVLKGGAYNSPIDSGDTFNNSPNAEPDSTSQFYTRSDSSDTLSSSPLIQELCNSEGISAENRRSGGKSSRKLKKKSNSHFDEGRPVDSNLHKRFLRSSCKFTDKSVKRQGKSVNWADTVEDVFTKQGNVSSGKVSLGTTVSSGKRTSGTKAAQGNRSVGRKSLDKLGRKNLDKQKKPMRKSSSTSPKISAKNSSTLLGQSRNSLVREITKNTKTSLKRKSRLSQATQRYPERSSSNYNASVKGTDGAISVDEGLPILTPEKSEKRTVKQKNHNSPEYEDTSHKKTKVSSVRLSIGRKSTHGKRTVAIKSLDKSQNVLQKNVSTVAEARPTSNKKSRNSLKQSRNNLIQVHTEPPKNRKTSCKQTSRQSIINPRNSECNINDCNESVRDIEDSRARPRRNISILSYKESPLKVEMKKSLKKKKP